MKSVPAANTKSAPNTERMDAGNPYAQYTAVGSMMAKRRVAREVHIHPKTETANVKSSVCDSINCDIPRRMATSSLPITNAIMALHESPVKIIGTIRSIVRTGLSIS